MINIYHNIPKELKNIPNWVCWEYQTIAGRETKIPINPNTRGQAMSNNPQTWSTYDLAVEVSQGFSGIGFMLGNGIFGIDIDNKVEEINKYMSGDRDNVIAEFIHTLESYAEYSPSGNGIHILCKGKLPPGGRRKGSFEFYENGRFFTVTGDIASEYENVVDCTESVKYLYEKYIGKEQEITTNNFDTEIINDVDIDKLIEIAQKSKQGQAFSTLYQGFWEGLYSSQSEADLAFSNMLAFWTSRDYKKMDTIFRKSGLMREKWDRKTGQTTYGYQTLTKAIVNCNEVFTPGTGLDNYGVKIVGNEIKKFAFDDTGNADRFVNKYKDFARYSYIDKGWYFYNGKKWEFDNLGKVKKLTENVINDMKLEIAYCDEEEEKIFFKHLKYSRNSRGKDNMLKESEHRLSILPKEFDKNKGLLNVENGVIDLQTGQLLEHDYSLFLSKKSKIEYTDKIDCPKWLEFLQDIFDNDNELIDYIQKAIGYSLTGSTKEQCVFFCYGNGRNGKSTFLDIINEIMGDYSTNAQPETIMVRNNNSGANSDIARLKGARFVTTVEPDQGDRINEGLIKQLTGGDTITARHLYGKEFEFEPEFKLWMATNHKPIIRGRDLGIWRRMHLIPFTVEIPENKVDKNLKHKLRRELTGILNWAVKGCLKWQKEGLKMPKVIEKAVEEYKSEMDVVTNFLNNCTVLMIGSETLASDLYKVYTKWATENNEYKMSNTMFGKEISLRFNKKRKNYGVIYEGLKISDEFLPYNVSWNSKLV